MARPAKFARRVRLPDHLFGSEISPPASLQHSLHKVTCRMYPVAFNARLRTAFLLPFLFAILASLSPAAGQEWAKKMFSETEHDFGTVVSGGTPEFEFEFQNLYEEDVVIGGVRSSCGCTTVSTPTTSLKSWEKGKIVAKFNGDRFRGNRSATLTVSIIKPFPAEVQLQVKGQIRGDLAFEPQNLDFGETRAPSEKKATVRITRFGNSNWKITDLRSTYEFVRVRLTEVSRNFNSVTYELEARLLEGAPEGFVSEQILIITNDSTSGLGVPLSGKVVSAITVSPTVLTMGTQPGSQVKKKVVLKSDEPFEVMEVQCENASYSIAAPAGQKKLHLLEIVYDAPQRAGEFRDELVIRTSNSVLKVPTIVKVAD